MTRSAADVGRGLAPARAARAIRPGERIHVLGAGGAGASAAAILAARAGASVTACDRSVDSPYVPAVEAAGVTVLEGHAAAHVAAASHAGTAEPGAVQESGTPASPAGAAPAISAPTISAPTISAPAISAPASAAPAPPPVGTPTVDRLAVTKALTAIDPDNPELQAARALRIPVEPWQQVVADAAATRGARLVGVAGTHGKSTSTGWLVDLLARAGRDPSAFVGALLPGGAGGEPPSTARWGEGPEFIVEADEYAGNFDPYRPAVAVLLNAEWDHPDVFADEDAVLAAFEAWIRHADGWGAAPVLVVNRGDPGADRVAARLSDWRGRIVAVALADLAADGPDATAPLASLSARLGAGGGTALGACRAVAGRVLAADPGGTTLEILGLDSLGDVLSPGREAPAPGPPMRARIALPGRHNAQDALCVAAAAAVLGVPVPAIVAGLAAFRGVGRRLELKGEPRGVAILDDYAHHPTAIAVTLAAVRQRYPGRRVWAVYEPLTYHRTAALLDRFADVLAGGADEVAIAEIWAGRDPDTTIASAEALAAAIRARGMAPATAPGTVDETADWLAARVRPGEVVLVMGGGHSYRIAARLVSTLTRDDAAPAGRYTAGDVDADPG